MNNLINSIKKIVSPCRLLTTNTDWEDREDFLFINGTHFFAIFILRLFIFFIFPAYETFHFTHYCQPLDFFLVFLKNV